MLAALLLLACRGPAAVSPPSAPSVWDGHVVLEAGTEGLPPDQPVCTVIAMHGFGDAPESFQSLFAGLQGPVQVVLPRAPGRVGPKGWDWFQTPQGERPRRDPEVIAARADAMDAGLSTLPTRRPVAGKPVVTGFSQGGMLAFAWAVRHPDSLRAAVPLGGELSPTLIPEGGPTTRIVAFHGSLDQVVPVEPTKQSTTALVQAGWPAEVRVYEGVPHSVPPAMAADVHSTITELCAMDATPR